MPTRSFIKMILAAALSCSAFAQQGNGRNYSLRTQPIGNPLTGGHNINVNGTMLTVPVKTGAGPYSSWGQFHFTDAVADTAGTNSHGMALYNSAGTQLCSIYAPVKTVVGLNTFTLSGCGVPAPNTSYTIAYLTNWSGDQPGVNNNVPIASAHCPGTSSFSGYVTETSFPSTLPATSAASYCYAFWADGILVGQSNGKYYGGNAGTGAQIGGIPTGPWGNNGTWYGGLNTSATFVNFSDGLSTGGLPTPTTLGNSSHGASCAWNVESTKTVITGAASGHSNLLTPVSIGSTAYGGSGNLTFQYTTGANRNRATCTYIDSYSSMSVGFHLKTDLPVTDSFTQYDAGGVNSADNWDMISPAIMGGDAGLYLLMQCEINGIGTTNSTAVPILPNVNYWVWQQKNTGGATQYMYVFNQDQQGAYVGRVSCAAATGTHNAGFFYTPINGAETNTAGYHIWVDQYEVNTSGSFLAP